MTSTTFTLRPWQAVFLYAAFALLLSLAPPPASAHCDGVKHGPGHPHCDDGGGGNPPAALSPEIVWIGDGIEVANGDGSNITQVFTGDTGGPIRDVSWAPGGKEILFMRDEGSNIPGGVWRLRIFDGASGASDPRGNFSVGEPSLVLETQVGFADNGARWSPVPAADGKYWIAYVREDSGAYLIDPLHPQDPPIPIMDTPGRLVGDLTWSPDASRIALVTYNSGAASDEVDIEIFTLSPSSDGSTLEVDSGISLILNNEPANPSANFDLLQNGTTGFGAMDWANTSDRLVLNSSYYETDPWNFEDRVWILPVPPDDPETPANDTQQAVAEGAELISVDNGDEYSTADGHRVWVTWSPDDSALAYLRRDPGGVCNIQNTGTGHKKQVPLNIVIASLSVDTEKPEGSQTTINCSDEIVFEAKGSPLEWWRRALPDGVSPPPLP